MTELKSSLLNEGDQFIVEKSKNKKLLVGTVGFVAHYQIGSIRNIQKTRVIIVRRGKGGLPRLEATQITLPIFSGGKIKKLMEAAGGRPLNTVLKKIGDFAENINILSNHYKMAWLCAKAKLLEYINMSFNIEHNPLADFQCVKNYSDMAHNPMVTAEYLKKVNKVEMDVSAIVNDIRKIEALMFRCLLMKKRCSLADQMTAISYLKGINKKEKNKYIIPMSTFRNTMDKIEEKQNVVDKKLLGMDLLF